MKKILLIRLVLVLGVLLGCFGLFADEAKFFEVSRDKDNWEQGVAGEPYVLVPSSAFYIRDKDQNITSEFKYFKSGTMKMDVNGSVETFKGTVGDVGSSLIINGNRYTNLPAGAEFEYNFGTSSIDFGDEGGEFFYEGEGIFGNIDPANKITAEGKVNIKDGVISSNKPFEISGPSGNLQVDSFEGGRAAKIGIDGSGKVSTMENAKINFKDSGFVASSSKETNVFYDDACQRGGNYLCLDARVGEEKLIAGGPKAPSIEMNGPNKYFHGQEGDYVKFSELSSGIGIGKEEVSEIIIEKDRLTAEGPGSWEIINGDDKLTTGADGNIYSSKLIGSENGAMPMKVYTSQNGKLGKYYSTADNNGVISTQASSVGFVEKGKYKYVHRGGLYDMPRVESEFATQEISSELAETLASNTVLFDGNFEPGEEVEGYMFCDKDECLGMGEHYFETFGTSKQARLLNKCADLGAICQKGASHTATIRDLYNEKSDNFYVSFRKENGEAGYFGNKELDRLPDE